ncbi:MAG: hypothetical protein JJ900_16645 [Rhodospirillales bacterium]|nr:hypothetical protein [Rhodospirillales bacterium]MBO6788480.1 hypothetical protein [Rhodospirillales bacterium]
MKKYAIALLVLVLAGWVGEFAARKHFRATNAQDPSISSFIYYDQPISHGNNKEWTFVYADGKGVRLKAYPKTNNMGYFSHRRYAPKDQDFNIVVIGGEQTASSTVTTSWPDYLEDTLGAGYKVYNIGWPDAGPSKYIEYWHDAGETFKPDLVIINYVSTDFLRGPTGMSPLHRYRGSKKVASGYLPLDVDGHKFQMLVSIMEGANGGNIPEGRIFTGLTLADPYVLPSRPYGVFAAKMTLENTDILNQFQARVVHDMVEGSLSVNKCMICSYVTGWGKLPSTHNIRNFDPITGMPQADETNLLNYGEKTFGWMARNIPNIVFLKSFSHGQYVARTQYTL